jgi:FkbM family methyltransferase
MSEAPDDRDLNEMLGEEIETARQRTSSGLGLEGVPLALYGAGNLGRLVLARLRQVGVEPVTFADDTPAKQGQSIDGLPVMSPQQAVAQFGAHTVFAVTVLNPLISFLEAERRLRQLTNASIIPFLRIAWSFPDEFLPYYQFELPEHVLAKAPDIRRALDLFADNQSRRQFVAHIRFRLWLDYQALPASSKGDYFPPDLIAPLPPDVIFIDCGAYDGDTVLRFLAQQRGAFGRILAFEPDETNCRRLRERLALMGDEVASRAQVFHAGVGARRERLRFNSTGNTSAAFDGMGNVEIDVLPLEEVVEDDGSPLYLKFDVEGAEREALAGAEQLIRRARPIIAISVYHKPNDLWELPSYLHSLDLGYQLFLRTQGEDGMDVICYALQPCHLAGSAVAINHG